jgi:hypothetical protein
LELSYACDLDSIDPSFSAGRDQFLVAGIRGEEGGHGCERPDKVSQMRLIDLMCIIPPYVLATILASPSLILYSSS